MEKRERQGVEGWEKIRRGKAWKGKRKGGLKKRNGMTVSPPPLASVPRSPSDDDGDDDDDDGGDELCVYRPTCGSIGQE